MLLRHVLLWGIASFGILVVLWLPAIPQDPEYHRFADQRCFFGVNHFFDVISNLPFLVVGVTGLVALRKPPGQFVFENRLVSAYRLFFAGIVGVGVGSIYYHMTPSNQTMIWDRGAVSVSFMALFTIVLAEYVSPRLAETLLYPLVLSGLCSVGYWHLTELQGQGDLRWYGLVQFLPLMLMPLILLCYSSRYSHGWCYWLLLGLYALAKVSELYDTEIFKISHSVSGHTLKHLFAASACAVFLMQLKIRRES